MDNPVKLHRFTEQTYEIVPPKRFTFVFNYVPHPLVVMAAKQLRGYLSGRKEWHGEISRGKMFGVLVVRDSQGELGFLAAFSGLLDKSNTHSYFVPPIYDMHHPLGHFRTEEAQISEINRQIHWIESSGEYISEYNRLQSEILDWKEQVGKAQEEYHTAKKERKAIRTQGVETTHLEALRAQSQYQKAELKRLKQKAQSQIEIVQAKIELLQSEIRNLQDQRAKRSKDLQQWLFDQFVVSNNSKQTSSLSQIFQNYGATTPPAGAGECACPKLLQYAYLNNLTPMAMGEFWQGESPKGEVRHHGEFYPSCNAKCKPILGFMLQGLEIDPDPHAKNQSIEELQVVYQDPYLMVVNKPEGVLSVRGKASSESIESLIPRLFPQIKTPLLVHRLDMATSGLLLIALNPEIHKQLQSQFESRTIKKRYIALLEGVVAQDQGEISLPLIPDYMDRPRQKVDHQNGKEAITRYQVIERRGSRTLVYFYPATGRTHQLRLHSAHIEGLNAPIVGDRLYGYPDRRLYLHAQSLSFVHPITHQEISLEVEGFIID